jgi:hypothetical protein
MQAVINKFKELLTDIPDANIPMNLAERFAIQFEKLRAEVAEVELNKKLKRAELNTVHRLKRKVAYDKASGSNIAIRKINAEAETEYSDVQEQLDRLDAEISYLGQVGEVCSNKHIFFRQLSR